jgi:hypothetical protein
MQTITLRKCTGGTCQIARAEVQRGLDRGLTLLEIANGPAVDPMARRMARCCRESMREAALMFRQLGEPWMLEVARRNRDLSQSLLTGAL